MSDLNSILSRIMEHATAARRAMDEWKEWANYGETDLTSCAHHKSERVPIDVEASVLAWRQGRHAIIGKPCSECYMDDILRRAGVPDLMLGCRFRNYEPQSPDEAELVARLQRWVVALNTPGKSLGFVILWSPRVGNGKTHLAIATMALAGLRRSLFYPAQRLLRELRESYDSETPDPVPRCQNAPLLILDDVGASAGGKDEQPTLAEIIDARHCFKLPTIITTNLTLQEFKSFIGVRSEDRIRQSAVIVHEMQGSSMRKKNRIV